MPLRPEFKPELGTGLRQVANKAMETDYAKKPALRKVNEENANTMRGRRKERFISKQEKKRVRTQDKSLRNRQEVINSAVTAQTKAKGQIVDKFGRWTTAIVSSIGASIDGARATHYLEGNFDGRTNPDQNRGNGGSNSGNPKPWSSLIPNSTDKGGNLPV